MYFDLLGRQADPQGLAFWIDKLAQGADPFNIAFGFAASAEREGLHIEADYFIFLGRQLDPQGKAFWAQQFLNGARNEDASPVSSARRSISKTWERARIVGQPGSAPVIATSATENQAMAKSNIGTRCSGSEIRA